MMKRPMPAPIRGSASVHPVSRITTAAISTPSEPSMSLITSK
jgi:hypothetical protein